MALSLAEEALGMTGGLGIPRGFKKSVIGVLGIPTDSKFN